MRIYTVVYENIAGKSYQGEPVAATIFATADLDLAVQEAEDLAEEYGCTLQVGYQWSDEDSQCIHIDETEVK